MEGPNFKNNVYSRILEKVVSNLKKKKKNSSNGKYEGMGDIMF